MSASPLEARIARVVTAVLRSALRDAGVMGLVVVAPLTAEARLLVGWCRAAGIETFDPPAERTGLPPAEALEWERAAARIEAGRRNALTAHAANRTELLLGAVPPEPLLPLGDVPAGVVAQLTGGEWSGSSEVVALAAAAGGIDVLDRVLYNWLERREAFEGAAAQLPPDVAARIRSRFDAASFGRRRAGLIPKLGHRTIGHDLLH